uniref:DNA mismatch repair protein S5 domain-containing protein n=1 Tax=Chaetoceros debilis TaxID=122233 RepID=A0A7S3PWP4_9STRA
MSNSDSDSDSDIDAEGLIAPIQQHDIRRIVAGQVVSDLASSVKELVDNALDADATGINIRLFNQGLDVIEVSDDGCGVPQDSRPLLAMKHATSKLRTFDELYQDSFSKQLGFRGEALFSLANISQTLVVSTRTSSDTTGTKMEFKRDGYLNANSICDVPRKVGTTVAVVKLFNALPVRRADLIKRITAQRAKMLRLIQSYAVLCVGVRFNLIDIIGYPVGSSSCKTEVKMSTSEKCKSLSETVSAVLGYKFLAGLCDIRVDLDSIVKHSSDTKNWRIEGLVSKAPSAMNANKKIARDIQFFCVNGRPVELPKMSRVVADAWRNFEVTGGESKKRPACILQIFIPNSQFDINIAPDKREVMFSDENVINEALRKALVDLWSKNGGKFLANEVDNACNGKKRPAISGEVNSVFNSKKRMEAAIEVESAVNGDKRPVLSSEVDNSCNEKKRPAVSREIDRLPKGGSVPSKPIELEPTQSPVKRRRMQRRNAFVNHFSNIGKASTDFSLLIDDEALKDCQVLPTNPPLPISRASEGITSTNPAWGRRETHTHSEEAKGIESVDQKSHEDHKRWNQMKLHFNSPESSSSQREEIEAIRDVTKMSMTKIDDLESSSKKDSSAEKEI